MNSKGQNIRIKIRHQSTYYKNPRSFVKRGNQFKMTVNCNKSEKTQSVFNKSGKVISNRNKITLRSYFFMNKNVINYMACNIQIITIIPQNIT